MKKYLTILCLLTINVSQSAINCQEPSNIYTSKSMVLNQFVFNDGNPNWGDWCLETNTTQENKDCNTELSMWDNWLKCKSTQYENSCSKWAEKENFTSNQMEMDEFINECVYNNFKTNMNTFCKIITPFKELKAGLNKSVICKETIKSITGSYKMKTGAQLSINIDSQRNYELNLNLIDLKINNETVFSGSGTLKWNPDGEDVILH